MLAAAGVRISMDGRGRYMETSSSSGYGAASNTRKVYLNAYASVAEAKAGIASWLGFYNEERQHQSLGYRTPRQAHEAECPWICGRSASPNGCAFAHIPTCTTANHRIDVDEEEARSNAMTVAPGAIGADPEIGGATP
jgi:Integrase core domain